MTSLLVAALLAGVELPRIGCSLNAAGELRMVWGIGGSFFSGTANRTGVRDAACSDTLAVIGDGQEFLVVSGNGVVARRPKTGERSLLSITRVSAGIWEPGWLHLWAHGRWTTLPVSGDWLAFSIGGETGAAVVIAGEGVVVRRFDRESGRVLSDTPVDGPVRSAYVWEDGALLWSTGEALVFRSAAGEKRMPLDASTFAAMSDDWVEARSGGYAIRRKGGLLEWFALP